MVADHLVLCVKMESDEMLFRVVGKWLHEVMKRDRITDVRRFNSRLFDQYEPVLRHNVLANEIDRASEHQAHGSEK